MNSISAFFSPRVLRVASLFVAGILLAAISAFAFVPQRAHAATVVTIPVGTELDFSSTKRTSTSTPTALNGWAYYTNVVTVSGVQIDAKVTTIALTSASIDNYDQPGSASGNEKYFQINNTASASGGHTSFKFEFFDHADSSPATIQNVKLTSIDLDSPGRQFTEFNGFNRYYLNNPTNLVAYTTNEANTPLADGLVRFTPNRSQSVGSHSNIADDAVEVDFDSISTYTVVFGNEEAQAGYFGVAFKGICDTISSGCTVASPVTSPQAATYTLTYAGNSSTGGSSPSNTTGNGNVSVSGNTGTLERSGYTFAGWNTDPNGGGTHYDANATYGLNADVTLYAEWTVVPTPASSTPAATTALVVTGRDFTAPFLGAAALLAAGSALLFTVGFRRRKLFAAHSE
jgi:uncharacterized repeat protein (TIGR02543 family)